MKLGALWLKIQIACGDALAMGPGKAAVLEAIIAEGSISAAARALGMSYRRAWLLVDEMNRCFDPAVVETIKGGGKERGARVTPTGLEVLKAYRDMERDAAAIGDGAAYALVRKHLRDAPIPPE